MKRVEALLAAPGGRSAIAARWFAPAVGSGARLPQPPADRAVSLRASEVFPAASLAKLPVAVELLPRQDDRFDVEIREPDAEDRDDDADLYSRAVASWRPRDADRPGLAERERRSMRA